MAIAASGSERMRRDGSASGPAGGASVISLCLSA
jgi:hypothetical protein